MISLSKIHRSLTDYKPHGMPFAEYYRILILRALGNFLVLFALYMISWVFYKPVLEEIKYTYRQTIGTRYVLVDDAQRTQTSLQGEQGQIEATQKGLLAQALNIQNIEVLIPKDPEFSIIIPKLGANSNIIANVDAGSEKAYLDALQHGVAHARGTKFPGEQGHVYLFAHSTNTFSNVSRYNAVFYLIYKLDPGDEIDLYHKGIRYKYTVTDKKVVNPDQVEYLTKQTTHEYLTLQTCWPPGTTYQRMLVFAERVME